MAKFNTSHQARISAPHTAFNVAGGPAFDDTPQMALYRQVATSLWSGDGYYERHTEWLTRFQQNVSAVMSEDVRFPFALAAYARDKRGLALRSSPIALYIEAVIQQAAKGTRYARQYAPRVLRRADEPAEAIAYFKRFHEGAVPHGLLRGIADTLPGFDEYQLSKYKDTGNVTLRDVFRLARPKPKSEAQRDLWRRVVKRELATPYTWETELSKAKGTEEKRAVWDKLIDSGKLGLFAVVRNLRNIIQAGADVENALRLITADRVQGSGILPFQWYKAYKAMTEAAGEKAARQIQQAINWSLADVSRLPGVTLVACDNSGSMSSVARTRGMSNAEIANLMGAMALACCELGIAGTFGDTFALAETRADHDLLDNKARIDACGLKTGHSTNAWTIFAYLIQHKLKVDRVILLSDMQCYNNYTSQMHGQESLASQLDAYLAINPSVKVYSINLDSQDNTCQFAKHQPVIELAGWSESIFQFIAALEVGDSVLDRIKAEY